MENCNHTSVGVIVKRDDGKTLLFQRVKEPFGIAPCAGHVEVHETYRMAAVRELQEETGLVVNDLEDLTHLISCQLQNVCRRPGGSWHEWRVYEATVSPEQELRGKEDESCNLAWYSDEEIEALKERTRLYINGGIAEEDWQAAPGLEPAWLELFGRIADINSVD